MGMRTLAFDVHGTAAPQGSKTPWGTEANPKTASWRGAVAQAAGIAMKDAGHKELFEGPLKVVVTFTFPRPKSRPSDVYKPTSPDLDKLERAIGDSLQGVVMHNDAQIAKWIVAKLYGPTGWTRITVSELG